MSPVRIQRRRTKGWRMPEGAVYVGRPTKWGNPWKPGDVLVTLPDTLNGFRRRVIGWTAPPREGAPLDAWLAVAAYRLWLTDEIATFAEWQDDLAAIRGRDLACWCPLNQPCHADVLLAIANGGAA